MTKELDFFAPGMDTVTLSEQGVPMPVKKPDGSPLLRKDGKPVEVVLYGPDSAMYRISMAALTKARTERASLGERTPEQLAKDAADDAAQFVADMTKSWNVTLMDDSAAPTDGETKLRFYKAFPDAAEQGDRFIARRARFMKAS